MFEWMLWATIAAVLLGMLIAYDNTRDIFHPLMYIGPMMIFLYGYIPLRMYTAGHLSMFFIDSQLIYIQSLNLAGAVAFIVGCLAAGVRNVVPVQVGSNGFSEQKLLMGAGVCGTIGLTGWTVAIVNVGGFTNAFSRSYGGGWDESGYVRDSVMLLLVAVLLVNAAIAVGRPRFTSLLMLALFGLPWLTEALLTGRRGPTFAFVVVSAASWYLYRNKRPPVLAATLCGIALGWFVMFLVANRNNIHLGSDFELNTDVSAVVETPNSGNEYVYGGGAVLSAEKQNLFYWGRRYFGQVVVRAIPSQIWPTKYEDFGIPEVLKNAGTGEGFGDALGWEGAPGSAPGVVADLWLEFWWLAVPALGCIGFGYGWVWRKAMLQGGPWVSQYVVLFALSIYLVMQTMEAVMFRTLILSIPVWLTWTWARERSTSYNMQEERNAWILSKTALR